jgi:hypothetical protein
VKPLVGNLPDQAIEQWPYRHFQNTKYRNVPLKTLSARKETWPTAKILAIGSVYRTKGLDDELVDPRILKGIKGEPAITFQRTGTWNIPILILENAGQFTDMDGCVMPHKHWLIEGHLRLRYLNYSNHNGFANSQHEVWLMELKNGLATADCASKPDPSP